MLFALALLVLPLVGCSASPTEPPESVPFQTVVQDALSARQIAARHQVVLDPGSWLSVWQEIFPGAVAPAVDFDREMTVVAVMAPQPCSARVTIESLRRDADRLAVAVVENPTPQGCACVAPVQPFHIVRAERLDLPADFTVRTGAPAICGS